MTVSTGTENTIVGGLAADAMTTGSSNTFIGSTAAGTGVVTGDSNTAVGKSAGLNLSTGGNNLCLGHDSGVTGSPGGNINSESNEICLGDENISAANIQVDWTVASDARDKTDFTALDLGLDFVKDSSSLLPTSGTSVLSMATRLLKGTTLMLRLQTVLTKKIGWTSALKLKK